MARITSKEVSPDRSHLRRMVRGGLTSTIPWAAVAIMAPGSRLWASEPRQIRGVMAVVLFFSVVATVLLISTLSVALKLRRLNQEAFAST